MLHSVSSKSHVQIKIFFFGLIRVVDRLYGSNSVVLNITILFEYKN